MSEIDFGLDIAGVYDFDKSLTTVTGQRAVAEAVARRLITPRGGLFYDPNYGYDVRLLLNNSMLQSDVYAVTAAIEAECEKDERVYDAQVSIKTTASLETLLISIKLQTSAGPFLLTLSVSNVTVDILTIASA